MPSFRHLSSLKCLMWSGVPAVVFHLIVSRLFIMEFTQWQQWRQWPFQLREAIYYYIHDRFTFHSVFGHNSDDRPSPIISTFSPGLGSFFFFFFFLAHLSWHFVFSGIRTAHRKETGKFRWKKAKSVYNQTQHLRWPNGRKCSAAI